MYYYSSCLCLELYGFFMSLQINAEFIRITTVPLQSTFFAHLDQHSDMLIKVFRSAKGVVQRKIRNILAVLDEVCYI